MAGSRLRYSTRAGFFKLDALDYAGMSAGLMLQSLVHRPTIHSYGERGDDFIEVHHFRPVHTLIEGDRTRLEDLALVCANCHRMIHRARPWLSVEELRNLIAAE